jgi:chemotaxis protein MotA
MIAGSAIGAFIVGNDRHAISATLKTLPKLLKSSKKRDKALYMELLALLYVLLAKGRKDGMLALESGGRSAEQPDFFAVPGASGRPACHGIFNLLPAPDR